MMPEVKGHVLHVFTREFADIALSELDTISDFCRDLRAKEGIDKEIRLFISGGEENLLGKYIEMVCNFQWMANHDLIYIDDTIWPKINTMPQYLEKKELVPCPHG